MQPEQFEGIPHFGNSRPQLGESFATPDVAAASSHQQGSAGQMPNRISNGAINARPPTSYNGPYPTNQHMTAAEYSSTSGNYPAVNYQVANYQVASSSNNYGAGNATGNANNYAASSANNYAASGYTAATGSGMNYYSSSYDPSVVAGYSSSSPLPSMSVMPGTAGAGGSAGGSAHQAASAQSTGVPPSNANSLANYTTGSLSYSPTAQQQHTASYSQHGVTTHGGESSMAQVQQTQQSGTVSRYMSAAGGTYAASQYSTVRMASGATEMSRVIGHEYGPERVVSVQQHVDQSAARVVSERYVEHEVRIPKRVRTQHEYEYIVRQPVIEEEIVEETVKVREKIVEVARPIIEEKIVERPEIEIREKVVEVPEIQYREKFRDEVQVQYQERLVEVPVVVQQERVVEVPEVQYREVPIERVVEVPELREEVVIRQVPVPQYVDKPVPQYVDVEVPNYVERNIPVPVEAVVAYEFRIPKLKGHYTKVTYPVYLPRFVETPIPAELYSAAITSKAEHYLQQISSLTRTAASLCEIENLAANIMTTDLITQCQQVDMQSAVLQAWQTQMIGTAGGAAGLVSHVHGTNVTSQALGTNALSGQTTIHTNRAAVVSTASSPPRRVLH
eukprot:Gregarina_sp_Pseudo_9__5948@NODE_961_length_2028_cov_147_536450_g901_i0_p1_GENE_NODE_961_length_2028_cov_147_536450_g901_i0NODE_961_length_2028_cov_147_536450_g901_i0_p1_ORF_typecomplete_len619_score191_58IMCp/PF12314_8/1_8e04IMCp/PF12314_8/1_4e12IMCp/PF12314_8/0_49_NODE_961_length_2028_cov_147_536450_g901_i0691925